MFDHIQAFHRARSIEEALDLLQHAGAGGRFVAGGTDLVVQGDRSIRCLVDITELGLNYIRQNADGWRIGATTTMAELESSPAVRALAGGILAKAAAGCGSVQIRNMATLGGNLANGSPAADTATPLLALDASVVLADAGGERHMALAEFYSRVREATLLVEVEIPAPVLGTWSFQKLGRTENDISVVNVAAGLELDDGDHVSRARIALGAVAPVPMRAQRAEALLAGRKLDESLLAEAAAEVALEVCPISDLRASAEYRRELSRVLVRRALKECAARRAGGHARGGSPDPASPAGPAGRGSGEPPDQILVRINGAAKRWTIAPGDLLLDVLRREGYFGVKRGCESGECGACTVLLDGKAINSCLMFAAQADGRELLTIEGVADGDNLDPLQEAFLDHGAVQCGYCTPGMILSAKALLARQRDPSEEEVRDALAGNLCRCTGYVKPVKAVLAAARRDGGGR